MSKTAKAAQPAESKAEDLPFEEALKKLETIVEAMESDELPLEALLARYEEGKRLAGLCQTKLSEAELRIQQVEMNAAGELTLRPVPPPDRVAE